MKKAMLMIMLSVCVLGVLAFAACRKEEARLAYPSTKTVDQIDDYFGTKVADPYRWLEDDNAEEVKAWVQAQNAVTFGYLEKIPFRPKIKARLTEIFNYPRYSSPFRVGEYYFFTKNDGLQNQSVYYFQKGLDGAPEVFLDPNALSPDGTVRVGILGASLDDKHLAISRGEAGSDWSEIRVMDIATRQELPDRILWNKFSGAAWHGDGFYYSGYDKPAPGQELKAKNEFQKVFYHKLGDPQEKDVLVWEDKAHPLRYVNAGTTEDEKWLFLILSEGTSGSEVWVRDLARKDAPLTLLVKGFEFDSFPVETVDGRVLVYTNEDAPNFRVVSVDPASPAKENWLTVIPEKPEVLSGAGTAGGYLFCNYLKDANTKIFQHKLDGALVREIELPALGTAGGFGGKRDEKVLFYGFTSFTYPPTIYKFDPASGASEVFRRSEVKFDPSAYETKQVFYAGKDGTKVPMFLVYKKGLKLDGRNPAFLYAYGGFNISLTPSFSVSNIILLENGGIYAMANLRGGGEYGEAWHKAGMLDKKQNVFDDFIAAAEYLVREKYTSRDRLAIAGGSNGGLLVGAVMAQRPELFGVAFPAVGVMDMLRFHKFTVGWGWSVEYGSSDSEKQFPYLYAYSPLHNLKPGVCYPATMVTTADHDDRVVPAHSFKFAATLQADQACAKPVVIRIETRSGHGSSNLSKAIEDLTDQWSFMFYNMGITPGYK
ncbi:MAG TPA: prolyl oligopeptidase family serine peptidase [Candidatus Aminicenantes bacterium]|nr:prolyl oligopeptidase family serine peptidase [Candidatus Aminicenantes bacterium]HRY64420.1 prolyl oligopeptidase family serine peptidase [Candidatus Aminicenantes bacterium]HRZ71333.1 prolyl oligopeptidase family serine peptidase [Candidatus Aminicenantes bacterium]